MRDRCRHFSCCCAPVQMREFRHSITGFDFGIASSPSLLQQDRDERCLHQNSCQNDYALPPIPLPEGRLAKSDFATRRKAGFVDIPFLHLLPVEDRLNSVGQFHRNARRRLAVENSKRQPCDSRANHRGKQDEATDTPRGQERFSGHNDWPICPLCHKRQRGGRRVEVSFSVRINGRINYRAAIGQYGDAFAQLSHLQADEFDHVQPGGSRINLAFPVVKNYLAIPGVTDKKNSVEVGHHCPSGFYRVLKPHSDDAASHARWRLQSREVAFIERREDNGSFGPKLPSPTQCKIEGGRADRDHNADRPVAIFFAEKALQILLVSLPPEPAQVEAFRVYGDMRFGVRVRGCAYPRKYLIV